MTTFSGVAVEDVSEIDLRELAERLRERTPAGSPVGYLRGKAYFRDLAVSLLDCSQLRAEELVDTLELRGYLRFQGDPEGRSQATVSWQIVAGVF
ncbi:MAG TPA: hypothetical protein VMB50_21925 [Myxococcales bacterium]|nr:hypothetical protein [Myxococcales bacterium]